MPSPKAQQAITVCLPVQLAVAACRDRLSSAMMLWFVSVSVWARMPAG